MLLEAVEKVNEAQKAVLFKKIQKHFGSVKDLTLAIWGAAFKPPRMTSARRLLSFSSIPCWLRAAHVRLHDPEALANIRSKYGNRLTYCDRPYGALEGADGLAIVTEWQEFRQPDFELMRGS